MLLFWFYFCLLLLLASAALLAHRAQQPRRAAVANLPGPYCIPLLGALHLFFKLNPKTFMKVGSEQISQFGLVQRVWAFNRLIILSSDLELNEQLLSSQEHLVKHNVYSLLAQWLGNGLLLSHGKVWHQRRKIITPTFHFKILEQFVEVFDQQSQTCVQRLAQMADGVAPFDVQPYICLAALDIIAETAMGTKVYAQTAESTPYAQAVTECTELLAWRLMNVFLHQEWLFTLLHPYLKWRQGQLIRTMHEFTCRVIEQRRRALQTQQPRAESRADDVGSKQRLALLDVLLQASVDGRPLSNEEIREEVDTFMFEGHDTTTSAICFALVLLARHPQMQAKLLAELQQVLGDSVEQALTMRHLAELKYMDCIIKETLRIYPSVPLVGRRFQTDFKYTHSKLGNGIIPAGSEFLVGLVGMFNDPKNFPQPEVFRPERHESASKAFALIPFSAGPRNCIGQKFAQLEMKVMLARIVREYELLPMGEPVKPVVNIVMRSDNGFQLGMRKRQPRF